jgi:hypothetical protein
MVGYALLKLTFSNKELSVVMGVRERLNKLDNEVSCLQAQIEALQQEAKPIFADMAGASAIFSVSVPWLRYRAQTGQLEGVAYKTGRGGKWLVHVDRMEHYLMVSGED